MITKTDVIILRTIDYGESSIIATVLSREHGKISLIAKGARSSKSKFGGMLQPGKILGIVYYYKPARSMQTVAEASYAHRLDNLSVDIEKMAISMSALELVSQLVHEGEVNEPVFMFFRNFLVWLDLQKEVNRRVFPYLQIRLIMLLGFGLRIKGIDSDTNSGYLNIESGTVSPEAVSDNAVRLDRNQLLFLKNSVMSRKVSILKTDLKKNELRKLIEHLDRYFRYHVEGFKPRRSDAIFDQILKDSL